MIEITLTLDTAWIGEAPEHFEHQPGIFFDGDCVVRLGDVEHSDDVDNARFRKAWREMTEANP